MCRDVFTKNSTSRYIYIYAYIDTHPLMLYTHRHTQHTILSNRSGYSYIVIQTHVPLAYTCVHTEKQNQRKKKRGKQLKQRSIHTQLHTLYCNMQRPKMYTR